MDRNGWINAINHSTSLKANGSRVVRVFLCLCKIHLFVALTLVFAKYNLQRKVILNVHSRTYARWMDRSNKQPHTYVQLNYANRSIPVITVLINSYTGCSSKISNIAITCTAIIIDINLHRHVIYISCVADNLAQNIMRKQ